MLVRPQASPIRERDDMTTATLPHDLAETLDELAAALGAMGTGDPAPYAALWAASPDVTLYGAWGPMDRGHGTVTTTFRWEGTRFSGGPLVPAHEVVDVSGDLAYTVGTERGTVRIDGGEPVVMTLRVTHVLRRIDGRWRLVRRHADFPPVDQRPAR
jgi:ketosteroid isomerase-like protein